MPDLKNRFQYEHDVARVLSFHLDMQRRRLAAMGLDAAENRTESDWSNDEDELAAALLIALHRPWRESYGGLTQRYGVRLNAGMVGDDYLGWIRGSARQAAADMVATNRTLVRSASTKWTAFTAADDVASAAEARALSRISATPRVTAAAATLTTAAASAGEWGASRRVEILGIGVPTATWHTERDDHVCVVCSAKHGSIVRQLSDGPPEHVWCRCWLEWE